MFFYQLKPDLQKELIRKNIANLLWLFEDEKTGANPIYVLEERFSAETGMAFDALSFQLNSEERIFYEDGALSLSAFLRAGRKGNFRNNDSLHKEVEKLNAVKKCLGGVPFIYKTQTQAGILQGCLCVVTHQFTPLADPEEKEFKQLLKRLEAYEKTYKTTKMFKRYRLKTMFDPCPDRKELLFLIEQCFKQEEGAYPEVVRFLKGKHSEYQKEMGELFKELKVVETALRKITQNKKCRIQGTEMHDIYF